MRSRDISLKTIEGLVSWIELNLTERMQIGDIAKKSGYSLWHFQRIFKRSTGITVGEYVRARRLTEAAKDLCGHEGKVIEVAISHGFENQQTFTRAFKTYFGTTPHRFRRGRVLDISRFQPRIQHLKMM